jgi:predicted N-acyltransferase
MRDLGSPTHSSAWFKAISRYYADNCIISIVKHNSTPIAAGLILINGKTATVPWASTLRKYNKLAPNMMLYWSLLQYATDIGCQHFDFGRSSINEGTFKFKKQWGAKPVELDWKVYSNHLDDVAEDSDSHSSSPLRRAAETVWQKLPLPLTIKIGSRLRRYISL